MEFFKNKSGVHLMSYGNSEYSICGDAWDGTEIVGGDQSEMVALQGLQKVTCKKCLAEIREVSEYLRARAGKLRKPGKIKTTGKS